MNPHNMPNSTWDKYDKDKLLTEEFTKQAKELRKKLKKQNSWNSVDSAQQSLDERISRKKLKDKIVEFYKPRAMEDNDFNADNFKISKDMLSNSHRIEYRDSSHNIYKVYFNVNSKVVSKSHAFKDDELEFFDKLGFVLDGDHMEKFNQEVEDWF